MTGNSDFVLCLKVKIFPNKGNISEIRIHSPIELKVFCSRVKHFFFFFLNLFYINRTADTWRSKASCRTDQWQSLVLDPECRGAYFITFPLQNSLLGSRIQRQVPAIVKVFSPSKGILTERPKTYKNILSGPAVQSCVFHKIKCPDTAFWFLNSAGTSSTTVKGL